MNKQQQLQEHKGQHCSLEEHWILGSGARGLNPGGDEHFPLSFLNPDVMIAVNIQINS